MWESVTSRREGPEGRKVEGGRVGKVLGLDQGSEGLSRRGGSPQTLNRTPVGLSGPFKTSFLHLVSKNHYENRR